MTTIRIPTLRMTKVLRIVSLALVFLRNHCCVVTYLIIDDQGGWELAGGARQAGEIWLGAGEEGVRICFLTKTLLLLLPFSSCKERRGARKRTGDGWERYEIMLE